MDDGIMSEDIQTSQLCYLLRNVTRHIDSLLHVDRCGYIYHQVVDIYFHYYKNIFTISPFKVTLQQST